MASKKRATRATREKRPVTAADMLALLADKYTFGPFRDKQIRDMLAVETAKVPLPLTFDPMTNPPNIFDGGIGGFNGRLDKLSSNEVCLRLGHVHGHVARIWHTDTGRTTFCWGCARHTSEAEARRHWSNGFSHRSGADRPHAEVLLAFVAAVCRYRGWTW